MLNAVVLVKFCRGEISPFDEAALECALSLPDRSVTILTMAPLSAKKSLEALMRLGADRAILLSDGLYAGSDTLATARTIAAALKRLLPDLILCGRQSMDGDTAQVPAEISALMGYPLIANAMSFGSDEIETRLGPQKMSFPCVVSVERIRTLRFPPLRSAVKTAEVWDNGVLRLDGNTCGARGSATRVWEVAERANGRRSCIFCRPDEFKIIIESALTLPMKQEKKAVSDKKLNRVFVVGEGLSETAERIAEEVIRISEEDPARLAETLSECGAEFVLFRSTLENRSFAPKVAALLGAGLAADCLSLETDGKKLFAYRPACGGGIVAKVGFQSRIAMVTVREREKEGGGIVFGAGAGARESLAAIRKLAGNFGAEIAASRKAVDSGLLPYEAQVGQTGKIICPKVYVAFGISGAVQHIAGIENAQTVIAVNRDRTARIYDYADFGFVAEIEEMTTC